MELKKYKSNMEKIKTAYRTIQQENEELKKELLHIKKLLKKSGIV
jgi:hypothetical protein